MTGNGDVFVATAMAAVAAGFGNRAGDFVGIDAPVGRRLGEVPRLAIRQCGVRATSFALGEALIDPVAIGLVFNDENPAIRPSRRRRKQERTGQ